MSDFPTSAWNVVLAASSPSVASALWVFWRWWVERGDKLTDSAANREQTLLRDLEAQRIALSREQGDLFQRMRTELERTRQRAEELETEHDRAWELARWWNRRAHELRHVGLNAQMMVNGFCAREGVEPPDWPAMELPALEEPK